VVSFTNLIDSIFIILILAIGFLPDKDTDTYIEFFGQLRASLEDEFNSIGGQN
jgi:hypothetical protein